jgi:hypothetical protein
MTSLSWLSGQGVFTRQVRWRVRHALADLRRHRQLHAPRDGCKKHGACSQKNDLARIVDATDNGASAAKWIVEGGVGAVGAASVKEAVRATAVPILSDNLPFIVDPRRNGAIGIRRIIKRDVAATCARGRSSPSSMPQWFAGSSVTISTLLARRQHSYAQPKA